MTQLKVPFLRRDARSFAGQFVLTAGTNVLLASLGVVTGILAARLLGPDGRGELAAIQLWPSFIGTVAMLGLPEALTYFCAREPAKAGQYLGSAMSLALLSSFVFVASGYAAMPVLLSGQSREVVEAARWYLLLVPLYALVGLPYHPLRGLHDFARWNLLRVLPALGWLAILLVAWWVGPREPSTLAMTYLGVLAALFFPVAAVVYDRVPGPYTPDFQAWKSMMRYGLPCAATSVPQMLNYRLDQMVMAALLPPPSLGLYVVAVSWAGALTPLLAALGSVLFPRVASERNADGQVAALAQGGRLAVLAACAIGIPLVLASPWGVPFLFGPEFAAAAPAASILVVASAVAGINLVLAEGLRGSGRPAAVLRAELAGIAVTLGALLTLLPRLGILGAALASLLGYSAVAIALVRQALARTTITPWKMLWPTLSDLRAGWNRMRTIVKAPAE